jgi:hypothetical protein
MLTGFIGATAAVYCFSAAHKVTILVRGAAGSQPVLRVFRLGRRFPRFVLGAAAVTEFAISVLSMALPRLGVAVAICLLAGYSAAVARLAPDQDCGCFGEMLGPDSRDSALRRNALLGVTLIVLWGTLVAGASPASWSATTVAASVLVLSPLLGVLALQSTLSTRVESA